MVYKLKPFIFAFGLYTICFFSYATSGQNYMARFLNYYAWNQTLPEAPEANFLSFIDSKTPLAKKLREKWLYTLGQKKNWDLYNVHYQSSKDLNLQCFA